MSGLRSAGFRCHTILRLLGIQHLSSFLAGNQTFLDLAFEGALGSADLLSRKIYASTASGLVYQINYTNQTVDQVCSSASERRGNTLKHLIERQGRNTALPVFYVPSSIYQVLVNSIHTPLKIKKRCINPSSLCLNANVRPSNVCLHDASADRDVDHDDARADLHVH